MAEKKYIDDNGLLYLWGKVKTKLEGKVDKVTGKGLSTNDYTTAEKNKLAGLNNYTLPTASSSTLGGIKVGSNLTITNGVLSADQQKITVDSALSSTSTNPVQNKVVNTALSNKVQTVKVNNTEVTKTNGVVNITVPTNNNQLTNGAGYQTSSQVQTLINNALKNISGIDVKVVDSLPTTGVKGTIYLVSNSSSETSNVYDEYIWVSDTSKFEKIGTTAVDLSEYLKSEDLVPITNAEIDTILAT